MNEVLAFELLFVVFKVVTPHGQDFAGALLNSDYIR